MGYGFKNYDELIFGNSKNNLAPFSENTWKMIMNWYWTIASIIGGPLLVAVVILAWKMIVAGISPDKRSEAKDNLMRLFFGVSSIGLAPLFVKLMLLLNNNLVTILVSKTHGSLDELLGNSLLTNIHTGNAIATAIVIALFAYLFVKINIKFIIRQFTLIVFTIFTPIVAVFWIINKRTIASSIWFGQIIINAFMQFVFAFLFLIYLTFIPSNSGWATSLLWGMMILPLADALQNTMQNLVSRIAGVNNEELAGRGIGMGAAMGYTIKSIAYQFKSNDNKKDEQDIITKTINRVESTESVPAQGISYENYSHNAFDNAKSITNIDNPVENTTVSNTKMNSEIQKEDKDTSNLKKAFNIGKEFMNIGMYMAEGKNFKTNSMEDEEKEIYKKPYIEDKLEKELEDETKKVITVKEDNIEDE